MCNILGRDLWDTETKNFQVIFQSNQRAFDKMIESLRGILNLNWEIILELSVSFLISYTPA